MNLLNCGLPSKRTVDLTIQRNLDRRFFPVDTLQEHYEYEKYLLPGGGDYHLPLGIFKPKQGSNGALVVLLDEQGMEKAASRHALITDCGQTGLYGVNNRPSRNWKPGPGIFKRRCLCG